MIVGLGIDVVDVTRLEASLERTPGLRERLFAPHERGLPVNSLAARLAAREALVKALGGPEGVGPTQAQVHTEASGRPVLRLSGAAARRAGSAHVHLSLTHDAGVAAAVVVLEE